VTLVCLAGALLLAATWLRAASSGASRAFGPGYLRWAFWALPAALLLDDAVVWAMGELRPGVLVVQLGVVLLVLLYHPRQG